MCDSLPRSCVFSSDGLGQSMFRVRCPTLDQASGERARSARVEHQPMQSIRFHRVVSPSPWCLRRRPRHKCSTTCRLLDRSPRLPKGMGLYSFACACHVPLELVPGVSKPGGELNAEKQPSAVCHGRVERVSRPGDLGQRRWLITWLVACRGGAGWG